MRIDKPVSQQPIPDHAQSVFKGKIFEVFQWQQEQYDGTFTTFEKVKRPSTVSVIPVTQDRKIILTKQSQPSISKPFYSTVGGVVDPGETPYEAVVRELKEETGYHSKEIDLWYSYQGSYKIEWELYMFVAKNCQEIASQQLDVGEKIELLFVDFDEFVEIACSEDFRDKELTVHLLREYKQDNQMRQTKKILGMM